MIRRRSRGARELGDSTSTDPAAAFVRSLGPGNFHQTPDPALVRPGAGTTVLVLPIASEPTGPEVEPLPMRWVLDRAGDSTAITRGSAEWHPTLPLGPPVTLNLPAAGLYFLSVTFPAGDRGERTIIRRVAARTPGLDAANALADEEVKAEHREIRRRLALSEDEEDLAILREAQDELEWVISERGLKEEEGGEGSWSWPTDPAGVRQRLEERIIEVGFEEAHAELRSIHHMEGYEAWNLAETQFHRLHEEVKGFGEEFRQTARETADLMLDASEQEIASALSSYGVASSPAALALAGSLYIKDSDLLDLAIDVMVRGSRSSDQESFDSKEENREALVRAGTELLTLQAELDGLARRRQDLLVERALEEREHASHHQQPDRVRRDKAWDEIWAELDKQQQKHPLLAPGMQIREPPPELSIEDRIALVDADIQRARIKFHARWIELEREHPALAAYRSGEGADSQKLHELSAAGSGEEALRPLLATIIPKLANIHRARADLDTGDLVPLELPPVVELTKRRLRVPPETIRHRVVEDEVAAATDGDWKDWAIAAVTLGIAILTAIPTGGSSLVLGAELAGLALDTYLALEAIDDYQTQKAAANTSLDRASALASHDPSLTWLAVRLASVPLNVGLTAKTMRDASKLRKAAAAGKASDDAVRQLDEVGEEHGLGKIGTEVVEGASRSAAAADELGRIPGRVQSRINIRTGSASEGAGWAHVVHRHFNEAKNASQFTISQAELRALLASDGVVKSPIVRVLESADGPRYVREIDLGSAIGRDKFSGFQETSKMTVVTDGFGNLVTATPGTIK